MGLENIVVIGSETIDAHLSNKTKLTYNGNNKEVIIECNGSQLFIPVDGIRLNPDGPIKPDKYPAKKPLDSLTDKLVPFSPEEKFGGGAYNSLKEIKNQSNGLFRLFYISISIPNQDLENGLNNKNIKSIFLNKSKIPYNIVLNGGDKTIIKSPIDYRPAEQRKYDEAEEILKESEGILANSLKDKTLVDLVNKYSKDKILVSVITKSLDDQLAYDNLLSKGIAIFNYDEFGGFLKGLNINCYKDDANEDTRIKYAIKGIKKIKSKIKADNKSIYPIYVTLGKNGALCSDESGIYHVHLNSDASEKVRKEMEKQKKNNCGAGDCFAGALFHYYMTNQNPNVKEAGKYGCIRALKNLGYKEVSDTDFIVRKIDFLDTIKEKISLGGRMFYNQIRVYKTLNYAPTLT